jgi:hypothetical protein
MSTRPVKGQPSCCRRVSAVFETTTESHPDTNQRVAHELEREIAELRLIAAHGWDIADAFDAGYAAAFVPRAGKTLYNSRRLPRRDVIVISRRLPMESSGLRK